MILLDTQVLSYAWRGKANLPSGCAIPSVVASEFLEAHSSVLTKAAYYIPVNVASQKAPHPAMLYHYRGGIPFGKRSTDQILLDLPRGPAAIEFGNLAITQAINAGATEFLNTCIQWLDKSKKKVIGQRLKFILSCQMPCIPVPRPAASECAKLYGRFRQQFDPKIDLRNTISDLLILATARVLGIPLDTRDSLLAHLMGEYCNVAVQDVGSSVRLRFDQAATSIDGAPRESKGNVNTPWRVRFLRYGNAP